MAFRDFFRSNDSNITTEYENSNATKLGKELSESIAKSLKSGRGITSDNQNVTGLEVSNNDQPFVSNTEILIKKKSLLEFSKNPIIQAIIRTRINQISLYSNPARLSPDNIGFKIVPKDKMVTEELTESELSKVLKLEHFIEHTGSSLNPQLDSFAQFNSSYIINSYTFDQINVEKVKDSSGKLDHFNILDAGTIVLEKVPKHREDNKKMLQYKNFQKQDPIRLKEPNVTFVTNNHASNAQQGYGYSKVEAALQEIQNQSNTEQYNARFFSQGGTTKGILVLDSGDNTQQSYAALQNIQRQWNTAGHGLDGAWRIPLIGAKGAQFVNMQQSSESMAFESYLSYTINAMCGIFQIDPQLIGFPNKGGGSTSKGTSSTLNEGNSRAATQTQDDKKGLRPLLKEIENFMNTQIMPELDDNFRFVFTSGDSKDRILEQQIITEKAKNGLTFNEVRELNGMERLTNEDNPFGINIYDLPQSPTFVQLFQLMYGATEEAQAGLQHKNDADPSKAENGSPDKAGVSLGGNKKNNNKAKKDPDTDKGTDDKLNND